MARGHKQQRVGSGVQGWGGRLDVAAMALLLALLVWAPLPLGSNRPWSWSLLAVATALALLLWALGAALGAGTRPRAVWPVALAAATTLPVWGWAWLQTLPVASFPWLSPHPLWAEAQAAGIEGAVPMVGLDAAAGRDALMRLITYGAVFWLAWRLGADAERARRLLVTILGTIVACAGYGLFVHLAGWETIGWLPKTAYIGDVTGTFVNRNNFATYANLGVVIAVALLAEPFLGARGLADVRRIAVEIVEQVVSRRWLLVAALAMLAMASLQTHSRGGLLSLGLTLVLLLFILFLATRPRAVTALGGGGRRPARRLGPARGQRRDHARAAGADRRQLRPVGGRAADLLADLARHGARAALAGLRLWQLRGGVRAAPRRAVRPTGWTRRTTLMSSIWSSSACRPPCCSISARCSCSATACAGCSPGGESGSLRWWRWVPRFWWRCTRWSTSACRSPRWRSPSRPCSASAWRRRRRRPKRRAATGASLRD